MTISFIAVPQHRSLVSAVDFRLNCIYRAVATGTIERQWRTTADDMRVSEDLSWVAWAGRTAPFVRCVTEGIGNSAPVDQPDVFSGHLVRSVGKTSLAEMLSTHRQTGNASWISVRWKLSSVTGHQFVVSRAGPSAFDDLCSPPMRFRIRNFTSNSRPAFARS